MKQILRWPFFFFSCGQMGYLILVLPPFLNVWVFR
jgi:hypothetical protein